MKAIIETATFYDNGKFSGFWFRVFGYGLSVRDRTKTKALFSERNGLILVLRIKMGR